MSVSSRSQRESHALHSVYLIARREVVIRVRSRVFRIATILIVLLLIGLVILKSLVLTTKPTVVTVGFSGPAQVLAQPLKEAARGLGRIAIQHVATRAVGENLVRSGTLDVLVSGSPLSPRVVVMNQPFGAGDIAGALLWFVLGFSLYAILSVLKTGARVTLGEALQGP